jgi:hypothetical protein
VSIGKEYGRTRDLNALIFSKPETAEPIVFYPDYPENVTAQLARARPYIKHYTYMNEDKKPFG